MIKLDSNYNEIRQLNDDDLVCYCFEYTKKNIIEDYVENGFSKILEKIKKEKSSKGCSCEIKNPKGK